MMLEVFLMAPLWVWGALACIIFTGVRALKTRAVSVYRLCIVPAIVLLVGARIFFTGSFEQILTYLVCLVLGCAVGFLWTQRSSVRIFKRDKFVEIPGSKKTLILFLTFFVTKYCFGILQVTSPVVAAEYALLELALSAGFSGLLAGISSSYMYRFVHSN